MVHYFIPRWGRIIIGVKKIVNFLKILLRSFDKFAILAYFASLGPDIDVINIYYRPILLRLAGVKMGKGCEINSRIYVAPGKMKIGNFNTINSNCRFACGGGIEIGSYCQIGSGVCFETITHQIPPVQNFYRPSIIKPIKVEDHVWVGTGAIILPGIVIGEGAVVAAGAVVIRDVEPYSVVGGVPAKVICECIAQDPWGDGFKKGYEALAGIRPNTVREFEKVGDYQLPDD